MERTGYSANFTVKCYCASRRINKCLTNQNRMGTNYNNHAIMAG